MRPLRRKGFTLIELLIFAGVFAFVVVAFITILITVLNVQSKEGSQAEVNSQSQYVLQTVQYYVERASLIDMPLETPTTTLKLYLGINAQDPTYMTVQNGMLYVQQTATGTPVALTSSRVVLSNMTFTRHANPPGHDVVSVAFTISYSTTNPTQLFSQALQTTVARVDAATFDSNLLPSSTATYNLGVSGQVWNSINQVLYFSGSNVGIGGVPASAVFELITGNVRVDSGDVVVVNSANGIVLTSPGGTCYRIKINNGGTFSTSTVGCP